MQQPTAPTAKHDSLTGKLLRRVAKINKAAEVEKGEKKAGIISGVTGKLYLALRPPTMGELDEWISCANIEALEMSIKYHPKEVSGLASLSTNPNTILTGMLEALRKKSAEAFFGLLKRMGITVEDDIRRGISKILLEYLNWNYSSVPTIHMLVTFVANNNLIPETGLIPTEKKAEVEKKMNQHLYYWLTYHSSHIKEEVHIGKQILELAPHFGISIHIEKIMAEIMKRAGISLYMTRSIEWIAENDIEVAEATFQGLVNCASHNTSGYTFQASGWIKSAKIHSQKKGWNIDFEGPTMNEVVYILTHRPGGNNGESLDAIINDGSCPANVNIFSQLLTV